MRALHVAFDIEDGLRHYAADYLARGMPLSQCTRLVEVDGAQVAVLERAGAYQVELCCVRGGLHIPVHRHPEADTIEVGVAGAVRLSVNGVDPFAHLSDARLAAFVRGRGIRINAGDWHGGEVLPGGALFLSIQRWHGAPRSVLTDYVGRPLGERHAEVMAW